MKSNLKYLLASITLMALSLSACQREMPVVVDEPTPANITSPGCYGGALPYIYGPLLVTPLEEPYLHADFVCLCMPGISGGLISGSGSTVVDYPGTTTTPWGEFAINYGSEGDGQAYAAAFSVPAGWVVEDLYYYEGDCANITYSGGFPVPNGAWQYVDFLPNATVAAGWQGQLPVGCGCVAMKANIHKVSFFGTPIPFSNRSIYFHQPLSNTDDNVQEICFSGCPPPPPVVTNVSVGSCAGCDTENNVSFVDCDSVSVESCQFIARLRVVYTDCSFQQYNGVGLTMNHAAPAGKEISHIFVKSGCNGPGLGRRIDGPCVEAACN